MLARDFLRTHFAEMPHLLRNRTFDPGSLARWGELDAERRRVLTAVEAMKAERNTLSAEVGRKKKAKEDATAEMERAKELGVSVAAQEKRVEEIEAEFFAIEQAPPERPARERSRRGGRDRERRPEDVGRAAGLRLHAEAALGARHRRSASSTSSGRPR